MSAKTSKSPRKATDLDILAQINLDAAGLDVGDDEIYACVPAGRDSETVRSFQTYTADLQALVAWLQACGVTTVAMESTGVYWIPSYELLVEAGLEVFLVNARHLRNVPAKKSDVLDCQWLQQLHTYGLLRASFRPADEIVALRELARQRSMLIDYRSMHIQHMQKALQQMNVKLTNVVTDITGVTGMAIIRAIVAGERNPRRLAEFREPNCKKSKDDIARALHGNYRAEHVFTLKQAVELFDVYNQQIAACDAEMETRYQAFEPQVDIEQQPLPPRHKRSNKGNQPPFDLRAYLYQLTGVDLTTIDSIDALTAQIVLTETGIDMSKWPTDKHFGSWMGLAPNNQITGGKVKRRSRLKTNNRAAHALCVAAQSLSHSKSALGAYYRRLRARLGPQKAIVATAYKLARIIYHMLKTKTPYHDIGEEAYQEKNRQRALAHLERQAKRHGLCLVPLAEAMAT